MKTTDRKIVYNTHSLCDWQGVERSLTRMAAKGWRLEYTSPLGGWCYRRAEPAKIHYAITYLPGLSAYDPDPNLDEAELNDLCEAAGWQKVCGWGKMMIYSNDQPDPVPLITDERLRLKTVHAAMLRSSVLGMAILLAIGLALLLPLWPVLGGTFLAFWSVCAVGIPALWLVCYFGWYLAARRAVAKGLTCPGNSVLNWLVVVWLAATLVLAALYLAELFHTSPGAFRHTLLQLICTIILCVLAALVRNFLRETGASRAANIALTLLILLLAAALVAGVMLLLQI